MFYWEKWEVLRGSILPSIVSVLTVENKDCSNDMDGYNLVTHTLSGNDYMHVTI